MLCVSVFSCENSIENTNTIKGKWNVTQIIGGFAQPKNYEEGSFTWNFNFNENTITIANTSEVFNTRDAPTFTNNQGGIYPFKITKENEIDYLIVGDRKGTIKLTDNELIIDFGIAFDDIAYIFKR